MQIQHQYTDTHLHSGTFSKYMLLFCRGTADKWTPEDSKVHTHTYISLLLTYFTPELDLGDSVRYLRHISWSQNPSWDVLSLASCTAGRVLKEVEETITVCMQFKCSLLSTKNKFHLWLKKDTHVLCTQLIKLNIDSSTCCEILLL